MVGVHASVDVDAFQTNSGIIMDCDKAERLVKTLHRDVKSTLQNKESGTEILRG